MLLATSEEHSWTRFKFVNTASEAQNSPVRRVFGCLFLRWMASQGNNHSITQPAWIRCQKNAE